MREKTVKKRVNVKKIIVVVLCVVLVFVLLAVGTLAAMFHREVATLNTIERPDAGLPFFTMEYQGDYGFDDFLATGASTDAELIAFITEKLLKGLPFTFDLPDLGCSTFSVQSPDGDQLFGRNFDLSFSPALLVKTAPDDGYESLSMVNLGFIGFGEDKLPTSLADSFMALAAPYAPLDGVNEAGMAIGVLLIDTEPTNQQTEKVDITTTTAIRMVLDKCASVDEALEMLARYDMHSSANSCYHFQIADASGRAVVVEYIGDEMSVIESPMATNFLLTEGDWDFGGGQDRFAILEEKITETGGVLTAQESMALLAAVEQNNPEKDVYTQWSVVYNQSGGTLDIAIAGEYEKVFSYGLDSFAA